MTVHDDLATLRWPFANVDVHEAALSRVEAEVARLEEAAAEAEVARLRDGLRRMVAFLPEPDTIRWKNLDSGHRSALIEARALLAHQDGAAQPTVYPANDWEHVTADCVVCPGCAFTFDASHVTQATGQYDCPVCHAQSRDGAAKPAWGPDHPSYDEMGQ